MQDQDKTKEQLINELERLRDRVSEQEESQARLKETERLLRENEERFRLLYENAPLGYQSLDENGCFLEVNQAWLDAVGYSRNEIIGNWCGDFLTAPYREIFTSYFPQFKDAGEIHGIEFEMVKKDGSTIFVTADGKIGRDRQGQFKQTHCILHDITERKKAEESLDRANREWERTFNAISDFVMVLDSGHRILRANKAMAEVLGTTEQELIGKLCFELVHGEKEPPAFCPHSELLADGEEHSAEIVEPRLGGTYDVRVSPVVGQDGQVIGSVHVTRDITERKQAEKSLSEKSRFIDSLLRAAPVPIFYKDRDGRYIGCNDAFTEIMGVSSEDIRGKTVHELWPGELADKYHQMDLELMRNREHQEYEFQVKAKDGEIHPVIYAKDVYLDSHGEVAGIVGAFLDITEHKRGERELQQSNDLLRAVIEAAPTAIIGLDLDGNVQMLWNPAAEKMLGWTADEVMGRPLPIVPPESHEQFRGFRERIRSGKTLDGVEVRRQRRDGSPIDYSIYASSLHDDKGRITGNIAVLVDITERKRAEEKNAQLAAIVESSDDAIIGKTLDGIITSWNKGAENIYGYKHSEVVDKPICLLVPAERQDEVPELLARIKRGEHVERYETVRLKKDGSEIDVSLTISPIKNIEGRIVGASTIARDITEEKSLQRQLIQAQKMEAIGQLAGGVAHDFNNILTAIIGYSDVLTQQIPADSPYHGKVVQIGRAGVRAAHLTRQLLAFSRKQILDLRPLNLNEVIANFEKMLRPLIGEDIEVVTFLDPSAGTVMGDPAQIEQILLNLAINARDAMPAGGKLTMETANASLDEAYARTHSEVRPGPYVMLAVSDTGHGMDPHVLPRVFEPFFTTKGKEKGTGLGLSTVYGIVKQHQGHVTAYSEPDRGTTFRVYLPLVQRASEQPQSVPAATTQLRGRETVLVVEDDEVVRQLTAEVLETLGYSVLQCSDPEEAKRASATRRGPIDLLLTDVVLPQMDGKSLFDLLSPALPEMRVLYVSGYAENAIAHHGVLDAGVKFLQKPFTAEALAKKVREVLDSG